MLQNGDKRLRGGAAVSALALQQHRLPSRHGVGQRHFFQLPVLARNGGRQQRGELPAPHDLDDGTQRIGLHRHLRPKPQLRAVAIDKLTRGEIAAQQGQRQMPPFRQRQRPAPRRQGMIGADHQLQRLTEQRHRFHLHRLRHLKGDAQIQPILRQQRLDPLLRHLLNAQRNPRIAAVERIDRRPHQIGGERRRHRQPQMAARQRRHVMDRPRAGVQILQRQARIAHPGLTGVGQLHPSAAAIEQRRSQRILQLFDLLRQGRLRDVQRFGGTGEIALFGHGQKITDMSQQHSAPTISNTYSHHYKWVLDPIARSVHHAVIAYPPGRKTMKEVIEGFLKFQREAFVERTALFQRLATRQNPRTLFISCSDSRLVPELVTQREPGDLFVIRNAGNIVPSFGPEPGGVTASVEYAVAALGVEDIVICGHSDCGAMTAIATCQCLDHLPTVAGWLRYADSAKAVNQAYPHVSNEARVASMVRENVIAQLNNIKTHPSVALALDQGRLTLHGWVYDIASGAIEALDGETRRFVPLATHPEVTATPAIARF